MPLRLYNTLTRQLEPFTPLEGNTVRMYACGPTVYAFAHIGNYRTFVFQDALRRYLKYLGYEVRQVVNLTDVDDNTIHNSQVAGIPLRAYTDKYIQAFLVDRQLLNLEEPEFLVRATDHIPEMVRLVQTLVDKGFAYQSEGSVYFKVAAFPGYGQLSHLDFSGVRAGARVDSDKYDKENARDFVLWKAAKRGRAFLGDALRSRPSRVAHRVLRHVDEVPGRDIRYPLRRQRPDLSRITKTKSRRAKPPPASPS